MEDSTPSSLVHTVQLPADEYTRRTVTVDFLYLDNESCERCVGTENALAAAIDCVEPILGPLDVGLTIRNVHVSELAAAEATQLAVSPTIRIDGRDVQPEYLENSCESCGDLCDCAGEVDCRLWRYRGETRTTAPVELLIEALVVAIAPHHAIGGSRDSEPRLSANVRRFFDGSNSVESTADSDSDCGCDC